MSKTLAKLLAFSTIFLMANGSFVVGSVAPIDTVHIDFTLILYCVFLALVETGAFTGAFVAGAMAGAMPGVVAGIAFAVAIIGVIVAIALVNEAIDGHYARKGK